MKAKIALLTGGYTGESEVSFKSSAFVYAKIDHEKYDVYLITITKEHWFYVNDAGIKHAISREDFTLQLEDRKIHFDLAFIMIHGTPGEDGRLQGYFDMLDIPYTSCDALTSSLTMNKGYTKSVLQGIDNLHMAKSVLLFDSQYDHAVELVEANLALPYFVKPNAGGSSIGMTKVKTATELPDAIAKAFNAENTGKQVIVEEFVTGREFSEGVYRNEQGELVVLPATEVRTTREFFDYEAKYTPGLTEEITPADLTTLQTTRIAQLLREIYVRLNCKGMVRIDFFLEKDTDKFYFIEINTIPGQTPQSFIPQQVRAAGMSETEFYGQLIEVALKK